MITSNRSGFALIEALIIVAIIAALSFGGYQIVHKRSQSHNSSQSQSEAKGQIIWKYDTQKLEWFAQNGPAPSCPDRFKFQVTPVDLSLINVIGPPGAYRGYSYKPHGGFRADGVPGGHLDVKMPIDAKLVSLTRYYEGNPASLQYLLTFQTDCGIAFRFDHLSKLTPKFQTFADKTPEAKVNDTRTDPNAQPEPEMFKAGEVVATEVGFAATKNFGFDFGVYDYRQRNEISKNPKWAEIHKTYSSLDYHGVCWFDMLPGRDAERAKQLSEVILNPAKPTIVSDYCANIKLKTLDINNGQPTDG